MMRKLNHLLRYFKKKLSGRRVFDEKVRAYLTLRCNLNCEFCVNNHVDGGKNLTNYSLLKASEWIRIFNTLGRDVVITGGEPFLYKELRDVVQRVNQNLEITIYSNLTVPIKGDALWLKRKGLSIYGSYHPLYSDNNAFLENIKRLKELKVKFSIHAIDVMGKEKLEQLCKENLGDEIPDITIDEDQREIYDCASKASRKKVRCNRKMILIAPDGNRYQCVSRMARRVEPFENLVNESFTKASRTVICNDYGYCAPCDGVGETSFTFLCEGDNNEK